MVCFRRSGSHPDQGAHEPRLSTGAWLTSFGQGTLIVTPPQLLKQWADELKKHAPKLRVLIYEGWNSPAIKKIVARSSAGHAAYDRALNAVDDEDMEMDANGKRVRRRSITSMPGSLEDMDFDNDEEDEYLESGTSGYNEEDHDAEDFDEDILAAGEMKNVPFL